MSSDYENVTQVGCPGVGFPVGSEITTPMYADDEAHTQLFPVCCKTVLSVDGANGFYVVSSYETAFAGVYQARLQPLFLESW